MPLYEYVCDTCGHRLDEVRRIAIRTVPTPCPNPQCAGTCFFDPIASMSPHTDTGYNQPILSEALGVDPTQIKEAQQRFPDHKFTPDGRMILESHGQRRKILKELGFRDWNAFS